MRQRRSGVRSEATAARLTLENLARERATIYPVLTFKPHPLTPSPHARRGGTKGQLYGLAPGFVRRRPVDRRDLAVGHPEVHRELAAVMHAVHQHEPQHIHLAKVAHLLGRHEELYRLVELCVGRLADALHKGLGRPFVRRDHVRQRLRRLRHFTELDPAVQRLFARFLLGHEYPREVLRGLAPAVRLQVSLRRWIGLEHSHRGGELALQCSQELLLLGHLSVPPQRYRPSSWPIARVAASPTVAFFPPRDLHNRTLDAGARGVPGPARGPPRHSGRGRAPLSGVAPPPAVRARRAGHGARANGHPLPP